MAYHFGPKRGSERIVRHPISVTLGDRAWSGSWEIEDGRLIVSSAYGSRAEPIGRRKNLEPRAMALLGEIVSERLGEG